MAEETADRLKTVEENGNPVKRRISTATAAHAVFRDLDAEADSRHKQWARISGLVDGNCPYRPETLKALGMGYRSNLNNRKAEAIVDTNVAALHELIIEVPQLINARPAGVDREDMAGDWGSVFADEYSQLLRRWSGFYYNTNAAFRDCVVTGWGAMVWPNIRGWKSKTYPAYNFRFPKKASVCVDEIPFFGLYDDIEAGWLFRKIQNEKVAKAAGWDVRAVKQLLVECLTGGKRNAENEYSDSEYLNLQLSIRNNDAELESRLTTSIRVKHLMVQEVEGDQKISHYILPDDPQVESFLYKKEDMYAKMSDILWLLPYDYGNGMLASVKGLGHRIFNHCEVDNRLYNQILDAGQISASLLIQPAAGSEVEEISLLRAGMLSVLPPRVDVVQSSFKPPLEPLIALSSMTDSILNNNTGVFRPRRENPLSKETEKTAAQIYAEQEREARVEKNQAARLYLCWDEWHKQTVKRIFSLFTSGSASDEEVKAAREFKERCIAREVPEEMFESCEKWVVSASRAVGIGSQSLKLRGFQQLMALRGSMDEVGRRNTEREYTAALLGGYHSVDRFFPFLNRDKVASNEHSISSMENNDFIQNQAVPVGQDQRHTIHLSVHAQFLFGLVEAIRNPEAQVKIGEVLHAFQRALPHMEMHINYLAQDETRKKEVDEFTTLIKKQFVPVYRQLFKQQQQIEAQNQENQQAMQQKLQAADETLLKHQERMKDLELKHQARMADVQSQNQARMSKMEVKIRSDLEKTFQTMMLEERKTMEKLMNDRLVAQAKAQKITEGI